MSREYTLEILGKVRDMTANLIASGEYSENDIEQLNKTEKAIRWTQEQANEAEQSASNCNIPLVSGSVFMLLDEDDDVITPLYTTKSAAIKRRAEMLEQNLRERITVNEIEVNKY